MGADAVSRRARTCDGVTMIVAVAGLAFTLVAAGCRSTHAGGTGKGGASGGQGGSSGAGGVSGAGGSGGSGTGGTGGAGGTSGSTTGAGGAAGTSGTGGGAGGMGGASGGAGAAGAGGSSGGAGAGGTGIGGSAGHTQTISVRKIVVGGQRACALSSDGVAYCWGNNTDLYGLMLSGSAPIDRAAPVDMTPLLGKHIVDIDVSNDDVCVLKDEGSVFCDGMGGGQLVGGIGGPAVQICVGPVPDSFGFGCAVRADGKVSCWSDSASVNLLGGGGPWQGTEASGVTDAVGIACTADAACAVNRDGTVWCWGGIWGQPTAVPEFGSDVATLQGGEGGLCAFSRSGTATCVGPLFAAAPSTAPPPGAVPELNGARALAIGDVHLCAVGADGTFSCRGANNFGQLADGTFVAHASLATATAFGGVAGASAIVQIAAGQGVTCARFADSTVRCVGSNDRGALGDGSALSLGAVPVALASGSSVAAYKAAGIERTASAVLSDGSVVAWGEIPSVLVAAGGPPRAATPLAVATPPAQPAAVQAFVTDVSACLRAADGGVQCLNTAPPAGTPATFAVVHGFESGATDLDSNCAVPASGGVRCGIGIPRVNPFAEPGTAASGAIADIGIGWTGGCLARPAGAIECWSGASFLNTSPSFVSSAMTFPVTDLGGRAAAVAVGDRGCALREDGVVLCWNMSNGALEQIQLPGAAIGITAASSSLCQRYTSGSNICWGDGLTGHACAWTASGDLYCWGSNSYGELGDGTTTYRTDVVHASAPGGPIISASAGNRQTCAILAADHRLVCWGWNGAGELGNGSGGLHATPSTVALP